MPHILAEKSLRRALDRWANEGGNIAAEQYASEENRLLFPAQASIEHPSREMLAVPSRSGQSAPLARSERFAFADRSY